MTQRNRADSVTIRSLFGMRIGNTSSVGITSANHSMAVLLPYTRFLTHRILFLCCSNKHQNKETEQEKQRAAPKSISGLTIRLFCYFPALTFNAAYHQTYRYEQQPSEPNPLTLRIEAVRSSETSEQFYYRVTTQNTTIRKMRGSGCTGLVPRPRNV
jgi:hypothetical protein